MNRQEWSIEWIPFCGFPYGDPDPICKIPSNILALVCWINSEGSTASCNPLDSELPYNNSSLFNSAGVQNYRSLSDGLQASRATLFNGFYEDIIAQLRAGHSADAVVLAINNSVWGSKPNLVMLDSIRKNYLAYAGVYVTGTPATVPVSTPTSPPMEALMNAVVVDGKPVVYCAQYGSNHLLQFTPDPGDPSGWSVIDITDKISAAYPSQEYLVLP